MENGYDGKRFKSQGENAAREYVRMGLIVLGVNKSDLEKLPKMDVNKALLARLIRRNMQMGLEWIATELTMGVRSSVTRAEKQLSEKMKVDPKLRNYGKSYLCNKSLPDP